MRVNRVMRVMQTRPRICLHSHSACDTSCTFYIIFYISALYIPTTFRRQARYSRVQIYRSSPAVSRRVVRAFGACDVYRNLPPRKGFVKIAGTFPFISQDAPIYPRCSCGEKEKKKREKKRRSERNGVKCEAAMIRPQKIIRSGPRDSLAV